MTTDGHEAAFSRPGSEWADMDGIPMFDEPVAGLSKREYFAAMAMQGILAGQDIDLDTEWNAPALGESALELAEGLIQALNAPRRNGKEAA